MTVAAKAIYNKPADSAVQIELVTKYLVNPEGSAFVKAKVDNYGRLALAYSHTLSKGVRVAFGGVFDTTKLDMDVHKVGVQFTFEG